jgi:NADH-quinone oxidoreductase subunit L
MTDLLWLVIALPLAGAVSLHFFGRYVKEPLSGWLASAAIGTAFVVAAIAAFPFFQGGAEPSTIALWEWMPAIGASFELMWDPLAALMTLVVTGVGTLIHVFAIGYMHGDERFHRFFTNLNLFAASMLTLVLAGNYAMLFLGWELVGLCSFLLIGFWYTRPSASAAAKKAFVVNRIGDFGFMVGLMLVFATFGTLSFSGVFERAGEELTGGLATAIGLLFLVGAAGKSAQIPLYVWLPDAMEGPTPVSALIHAATMVTAGVYLLHRLSWLFALTPDVLMIVAWIGAFTALLAAVLACVQDDIKRVLAYSTVSQLGYMMTAIGAGFAGAGFFHLLTHGVFKALLFLGAGAVIHAVGTNNLSQMGHLARRMPQTMIVFVVGTLSLAGIPLFAGFLSKEEILGAVWAGGLVGPFALLMLVAFLTAFYMFRVVFLAFFGAPVVAGSAAALASGARIAHAHGHVESVPDGGHVNQPPHAHDAPATMGVPLWILAGLSMIIGIYFTFEHPETEFVSPPWLMPSAVGVAAAGILLAWATYQRRAIDPGTFTSMFAPLHRAALKKFWIDDLFEHVIAASVLAFSRAVGWLDRYIVDGVLNALSAWTLTAGDDMRTMQSGRAQDYVYGVAVGLLVLLLWVQFR